MNNGARHAIAGAMIGIGAWYLFARREWDVATGVASDAPGLLDEMANQVSDLGYQAVALVSGGVGDMEISFAGLAMIKNREKLRLNTYTNDGAGVPTIGWGHKLTEAEKLAGLTSITREQADALLAKDVSVAERAVNRLVTVQLNQNQFDALVSFVYNIGADAFAKSTMLQYLNAGDYFRAANEFGSWVFVTVRDRAGKIMRDQYGNKIKKVVPGLAKRRTEEYQMFTGKSVVQV